MKLASLVSVLLLSTTAVAAPPGRWQSADPGATVQDVECRETVAEDPVLDAALRSLTFEVGDSKKSLAGLRITGLSTIAEAALWEVLGGRPATPDAGRAALVLRRLAGLGLFAAINPVLEMPRDGGPVLVLHVTEHPTVRKVAFEGLGELEPESLLRALLEAPDRKEVERRRVRPSPVAVVPGAAPANPPPVTAPGKDEEPAPRCPDPLPPRDWLARAEDQVVFPGVVWRGLDPALERVMERIFDKGYEMASISGELGADGTLTVKVDEGRFDKLELSGVEPRIEPRVRELLGLNPGEPFVRGDVEGAADRLRARFPFLRPNRDRRETRQVPRVVAERTSTGPIRFSSVEQASESKRRWFAVSGRTVTLHLEAERFTTDVDATDIIRHTPATDFAPGLELKTTVWNASDLVHLHVRTGANVNTRRAQTPVPAAGGEPERWRFDWLAGGHLQVPQARVAELGVVGYAQVDTADRWRLDRLDSYLYSLVINRPDSEYFRRSGFIAFVTAHIAEHLTAGAEYRRDRYKSLTSAADVFTVFNRDEGPRPTPAINDGRLASLLFRLELTTHATPAHKVGVARRDPERSIVDHGGGRYLWTDLRTVNTLEVADQSLGGDFAFVRLVSDSAAFIKTGHRHGLLVRFRAAGKLGGEGLPAQKQEALGGWSALRGYDFKEYRAGDFSLLGTVEYRFMGPSVFVDVGSLRTGGSFGTAKTGAGLSLNFTDDAQLAVAWRTDDDARLRPEIRLLFERTF